MEITNSIQGASKTELAFKQQFIAPFEQLQNQEISDLNAIRQENFDAFLTEELPTSKNENWKYTSIRKLIKHSYISFATENIRKELLEKLPLSRLDAYKLVFVNGVFREDLSNTHSEKGIVISNLQSAWTSHSELIKTHIQQSENRSVFTSLNKAFITDGAFILVEKSKVVQKPIYILNIADTTKNNIVLQPHNIIVAAENSQLTILDDNAVFGDNKYFKNAVSTLVLEKNAIVRTFKIQNLKATASLIETLNVSQKSNTTFTDTTVSLAGDLIRNNIHISLNGQHCEANMNGLFAIKDETKVDNSTSINHIEPNSESNQLYKGILGGTSKGVFNGRIYVQREAQKTNAFQSNKNILLSEEATINTKPQLEIWADDVKCSHGTTTGALNEEQLFYLQSRGIPKNKARGLLIYAFASEVLDRISIPMLKNYLQEVVENHILSES